MADDETAPAEEAVVQQLPLDVAVMDLRSLLQMLRSPEEHIKEYAVRALLGYAEQDAKAFQAVIKLGLGIAEGQILMPREDGQPEQLTEEEELLWRVNEFGVVAFFCTFLETRNKLQIAALEILAFLTRDQGIRDHMRHLNSLPFVSDSLAPTTEDLKMRIPSLEIVKNFASEQRPETLTEMRECVSCEGACNVVIPGIVDLMVNNEELEENAMVALAYMCRDTESRFRVREQGGIKYLVFAMSRVFVEASNPRSAAISAAAVNVLVEAADDPTNKKELTRFGGVGRLMDLMQQTDNVAMATNAAIVLDKIVQEVENRHWLRDDASRALLLPDEIETTAGLLRLIDVLGGKVCTEVLRPGLSALAYCSYDSLSCDILAEHGGVATVSRLLASGGGGKVTYGSPAKASAATVLANMARDPSLCLSVIRSGGVPAAIRALNDKEAPTQTEAAIALHRLALDNSGLAMAQMKKAGVIKRLIELLTCGEESPAYASALAIESYVRTDEEARKQVLEEGALPAVVSLLREGHEPRTRCAAAGACEFLALDEKVRDALDHEGCTEHLAHMLDMDHLQVLHASISACKTMAVDEPIANNLCLHGGYTKLTKLVETSLFPKIRNGASEVVEQLLKINLAMKFYLQGRLPPDVKIRDGFFVQFGGSGFRTAEELRKEPQDDQNIECLTLDSVRDPDYAEFISQVSKLMASTKDNFQAQVRLLSNAVADRMGGPVNVRSVANLGCSSQIARVKAEIGSHAVPIGKIKRGSLRHRAFLFKALADTFGVACSLERSEDGWRMWNCVNVKGEQRMVDLMMKPGEAYHVDSPEGQEVLTLEVTKNPETNVQHGSLQGPSARKPTILDENLFPHTAISYRKATPHFTVPSLIQDKAKLVNGVAGNAELPFQPNAGAQSAASLGGRGVAQVAFDYESKRAEVCEALKAEAAENPEHTGERASLEAVYDWISKNVRYAYGKGTRRHLGAEEQDASAVLQRRRGTSEGFSALLVGLCEGMGLTAEVVKGHCKLYDMLRGERSKPLTVYVGENKAPEEPVEPPAPEAPSLTPEHWWNIVKIDGVEVLVDVCAKVYLASESGEIQGFCGTPAAQFVLDHLPDDESKQLMGDGVIDRETFIKTGHLRPGAEALQVKLISHPGAQAKPMVETRKRTSKNQLIVLRCPEDVIITAKLLEYGLELPASLCLVHRRDGESFVDVAAPSHGAYTLRLFAQRMVEGEGEVLIPTWISDYTMDIDPPAQGLLQGRVGYAEVLPPAHGKQIYLRTPQQMNLESKNSHFFDVEIPGATAIAIGSSKTWLDLNADFGEEGDPWAVDGRFRGMVYLPHGGEFLMYVSVDEGPYTPYMKFFAM